MDRLDELYADYRRARYFPSLDGLRCLSIIAVIWFHCQGEGPGGRIGLLAHGDLGVALFFVISGFLITTLLLRERDQDGEISLKGFYLRRTLRIFPLYYAAVGLYVLAVLAMDRHSPEGHAFFRHLPFFLTYTNNWFVPLPGPQEGRVIFYFAWSLATEEQFYLLWPTIVRFSRMWMAPVVVASLTLIGGEILKYLCWNGIIGTRQLGNQINQCIAAPICMGCLLAYAMHFRGAFGVVARARWGRWWSAPMALAFMLVAIHLNEPRKGWWPGLPAEVAFVAMAGLVGACCIQARTPLRPLFANRIVRYIGTISYGMYLLHMLCLNAVRKITHGHGTLIYFAAGVAATVVVASISYWTYERRFLNLKDRLHRQRLRETPGPISERAILPLVPSPGTPGDV